MTPPVFYPVNAVPEMLRPTYQFNPLGAVIETSRAAASGYPIEMFTWGMALIFSLVISILGYAFFHRSRDEFADAL